MAEERVQRRLAAILAADVVGYSRMMSSDEPGTLLRLKAIRSEVFDPKTEQFGGRIFKTTGDGALVEFGSAVDAVQCSVEIQRELAQRNADASEDQRMALRIGISLGDVVVDGDDLYGHGVNVAARMEGLAEPGGICISGNVQEHIGNTLDVDLKDLGEQTVKNIDRPVRCYRVYLEPDGTTDALQTKKVMAYDLFLQAHTGFYPPTVENILWARRTYERVIDLDPASAGGYAGLSMTYTRPILLHHYEMTEEDVASAQKFADEALRLDNELAASHMAQSLILLVTGDHDGAITFARNAVQLQPGDSDANANLGRVLYISGHPEDAFEPFKTAIRLDPQKLDYYVPLGFAYCMAGRFTDAIEAFRLAWWPGRRPSPMLFAGWVAAAIEVGNADEAAAKAKLLLAIISDFKVSEYSFLERFAITGMKDRMVAALIKAGLPE